MTIQQAADELGVSYSAVYKRLTKTNSVPYSQAKNGVITIARSMLGRLKFEPREHADEARHAVMLRPANTRYETWRRAAGDKPVSKWLADLADRAAGRAS